MCIMMASIHLQDHGGNASSAMTSSILPHCAANLVAIRLVATAGVAKMNLTGEAFACWYWLKENHPTLFAKFQNELEEEE